MFFCYTTNIYTAVDIIGIDYNSDMAICYTQSRKQQNTKTNNIKKNNYNIY